MKRVLVLSLLVCASACQTQSQAEARPAEPQAKSATTRLARAAPPSSLGWLEAPARALAAPDASAVISTPLPARILRVRVKPGDQVRSGAPLVEVSMPDLIVAAGQLSAASIRIQAFEKRQQRVAPLAQQGLVRSADLTELEAQTALAKADRETARATLRSAGLSDERAAQLLAGDGTVTLRSPIEGMVVSVQTKVGEMRDPASGPLLEIASSAGGTLIEARFSVPPPPDAELLWIEAGRSVELVQYAMSPVALREDGTRVIWLRAKSPADSRVAHALGRVRVVAPAAWSVIPARALIRRGDKTFVAVPEGTGRKEKPVSVAQQTPNECVVTGLRVGDEVFLGDESEASATP